jgi:hypothetical protein
VHEKEEGWKSSTARDSYTAKLKCLELMGIKVMRDALYKRGEQKSKRQQNGTGNPEAIQEAAPIEEVATYFNDQDVSSISSPSNESDTNESSNETMVSLPKAGRPKGSTHQKKRLDIKNYKKCINAITEALTANSLNVKNKEDGYARLFDRGH